MRWRGRGRKESKLGLESKQNFWELLTIVVAKKKLPSNKEGQADLKILSQALEILNHTKRHHFKAYKHKRIKVSVPPKSLRKQRLVLSTEKKHKSYGCSVHRKE